MLWFFAEEDLLNAAMPPEYKNTGQGFHRVQPAPKVGRAMHAILAKVQSTMEWVGSSTVHLGDHNVPNALMFIDKYTQVQNFSPYCICARKYRQIVYTSDHKTIYTESIWRGSSFEKNDSYRLFPVWI